MKIALVSGSCGLVGFEACKRFHAEGMAIVGLDNDMRRQFHGDEGTTANAQFALRKLQLYNHEETDIRDWSALEQVFRRYGFAIGVVVHAAAQTSEEFAVGDPMTDFDVNALGTMHLLEATRRHCPEAPFIFTSSTQVYGDRSSSLPLVEKETRWEIADDHPWHARGVDESMSIDASRHSVPGASKGAADIMVQEYGRSFGLKTGIFRCGNLCAPVYPSPEPRGMLAHLMACTLVDAPCTIHGHKGKQVADHLHAQDLVDAFCHFMKAPRSGENYNLGGSRHSHCSVIEAIKLCEKVSGKKLEWSCSDATTSRDPAWWITDVAKFQSHYPDWKPRHDVHSMLKELHTALKAG